MDNHRLSKALGFDVMHFERWAPFAERLGARRESESGVFQMEGYLVSSEYENWTREEAVGFTTPNMLRQFLSVNAGQPIRIDVNSPGGDIFAANAMLSDILRHDGKVEVVATGAAFSAAADMFTLPDADRVAMPGSMFMIHNASTFAFGDAHAIRKVAERLDKINKQCADRMVDAWTLDRAELVRMMDDETWFTETEALEAGIVDRVWAESEEDAVDDMIEQSVGRGNDAALIRVLTAA